MSGSTDSDTTSSASGPTLRNRWLPTPRRRIGWGAGLKKPSDSLSSAIKPEYVPGYESSAIFVQLHTRPGRRRPEAVIGLSADAAAAFNAADAAAAAKQTGGAGALLSPHPPHELTVPKTEAGR